MIFSKNFVIEIHEKHSTVYYRLSKCNLPKKIGCNRFRVLNKTPIINGPLNVKFSHFFMNKKYSYFRFFLTSPEHRYSSAGSNKIIKKYM